MKKIILLITAIATIAAIREAIIMSSVWLALGAFVLGVLAVIAFLAIFMDE